VQGPGPEKLTLFCVIRLSSAEVESVNTAESYFHKVFKPIGLA